MMLPSTSLHFENLWDVGVVMAVARVKGLSLASGREVWVKFMYPLTKHSQHSYVGDLLDVYLCV